MEATKAASGASGSHEAIVLDLVPRLVAQAAPRLGARVDRGDVMLALAWPPGAPVSHAVRARVLVLCGAQTEIVAEAHGPTEESARWALFGELVRLLRVRRAA
jgi:hypothetical protein